MKWFWFEIKNILQVKFAGAFLFPDYLHQLNQQLQTICKICYSIRKEINFNELPEEIKKEIGEQHDRSIKFFH